MDLAQGTLYGNEHSTQTYIRGKGSLKFADTRATAHGVLAVRFMRRLFPGFPVDLCSLITRVVHGPGRVFLRATFTPPAPWQYSSLNAAHAVMSRSWDYVIGPCSVLPILPLRQLLLLLHLPGVILLSLGASI